ncbi:winged helix-turn-helix domain-containing protein [Sphingomonas sp. TX0543]|uniref:winged helix-turn-helix domain-containing protein n=1 Tax=Sphingomonas sp. TX0543 TaxID=3399682 RepID=UPI003AFA2559
MAIDGPLKLSLQILRGGEPAIGPGKAIVLEAIGRTGSISGAGRSLGMSYRKIWRLVDALNDDWRERVVETQAGRGEQSGARLTDFGADLLARYRATERRTMEAAAGADLDWLLSATKRDQ